MDVQEIAPRLWHWTAPHPEWKPGSGWEEAVSSYALVADDAFVLFDPLVPEGDSGLWEALDRDVEHHGPPSILITIFWHVRSAPEILERYEGASVWAHAAAAEWIGERTPYTNTFEVDDPLPGGVEAVPMHHVEEVAFWLPSHKATVLGDTVLGGEGRARLLPPSWIRKQDSMDDVRAAVHRILKFPENRLLLTHGGPTDPANLDA